MSNNKSLILLGYAADIAGPTLGCADGPYAIQHSTHLQTLVEQGIDIQWSTIIKTYAQTHDKLLQVREQCEQLAKAVIPLVQQKKLFAVIGGDHTSAIGTWSAVSTAIEKKGSLGLIWIDAHMDSHTPETSLSGNLHGMPLACLLGQGDDALTHLLSDRQKLKPEHLCLIGVRSFESGEANLLKKLNVRIYFIEEVKQRGLNTVLAEAIKLVSQDTIGYGLSIDIDSIDPIDAPGTDTPEPNGLNANELCKALTMIAGDSRLLGLEIAEFNPQVDLNQKTEKLIARMLQSILL